MVDPYPLHEAKLEGNPLRHRSSSMCAQHLPGVFQCMEIDPDRHVTHCELQAKFLDRALALLADALEDLRAARNPKTQIVCHIMTDYISSEHTVLPPRCQRHIKRRGGFVQEPLRGGPAPASNEKSTLARSPRDRAPREIREGRDVRYTIICAEYDFITCRGLLVEVFDSDETWDYRIWSDDEQHPQSPDEGGS
jgi:hypothetical protein